MAGSFKSRFAFLGLITLAALAISCATNPPEVGRILLSIAVTPETADAGTYPDGQVTFTANGTFSVAPTPALLSSTAPYNGQIIVANPTNPPSIIANIVSTGNGTITVQCASGASGQVQIIASGSANNGTPIVITGSAQLTCP